MDREKGRARGVCNKDERKTNYKIDKVWFEIEKKVARTDGKHAPLGNDD